VTKTDHRLVVIEWEGNERPRIDVMRELYSQGVSVGDIARRLDVRYQIAYMALKGGGREASQPSTLRMPPSYLDPDVILIGCVSQKGSSPAPAKDLYRSELFRRRRLWAEASGHPWWIASAKYGLVHPDEIIAPYDTHIGRLPPETRARLASQLGDSLERALGSLRGRVVEIHAGEEYVLAFGPELRRRGAELSRPLQGLLMGEQLAWYGQHLGLSGGSIVDRRAQLVRRDAREQRAVQLGDGRGLGRAVTDLFMSGQLDLRDRPFAPPPGWEGMPEVVAVRRLEQLGAKPPQIRLFLTFCAAMDRARDADKLARSATDMFEDEPWAYEPAEVASRSLRELADVLRRFKVSQRHRTDAFAWRVIAESLLDVDAVPEVRSAIYNGRGDARELLRELALESAHGTPLFPLLSGPKISALWVRLLAYPGRAKLSSMSAVPVAVDVQVRKVTEYLGVTDTAGRRLEKVRELIQATWAQDVELHGAAGPDGIADTPGALDPALWFYGKWGCTFCEGARRQIPISPACGDCTLRSE
jgi:hypothetical protein